MTKILFICHGNICRSPIAASLFQDVVDKAGTSDQILIDSAATSREEIGNPIYPPMMSIARKDQLPLLDHRARQVTRADVDSFDLLIVMDQNNKNNLLRMFPDARSKVHYLTEYSETYRGKEIEDPWWTENYIKVYEQIKECVLSLYHKIK